jgi:hypothetical protein
MYASGAQGVHGLVRPLLSEPNNPISVVIDLGPDEHITSISGTNLTIAGSSAIRGIASLTFTTNKRVFAPFGTSTGGAPFKVQGPVYGFHGAATRGSTLDFLTAIGVWKLPAGKQVAMSLD